MPRILIGDCLEKLRELPDSSVDLIFTSPPYADQRKNTYGGITPDEYVAWFMPRAREFFRVLKPTGSFVLNIKERVVNGERHTYVIDLIEKMRGGAGFGQRNIFGIKRIATPVNGQTDFGMLGNGFYTLQNNATSKCFKMLFAYRWATGKMRA